MCKIGNTPTKGYSITENENGLTVTVKYGKGYEETWVVFRGSIATIRRDVIMYFGLDGVSMTDMTLSEVVINVTQLAHAKGNVAAALGGVVIVKQAEAPVEQQGAAGDVWGDEPVPVGNPILAAIDAITTITDLKLLWSNNQSEFADSAVMDAWKVKGKALQAA